MLALTLGVTGGILIARGPRTRHDAEPPQIPPAESPAVREAAKCSSQNAACCGANRAIARLPAQTLQFRIVRRRLFAPPGPVGSHPGPEIAECQK